jgi:hypothetical protein
MKWMRERDALVAQTLAFVQSVTGRKEDLREPEAPTVESAPRLESASVAAIECSFEAVELSQRTPVPPPPQFGIPGEFQAELRERIASFRQHQERFRREREEYFSTTLARARAALRDTPPVRPEK